MMKPNFRSFSFRRNESSRKSKRDLTRPRSLPMRYYEAEEETNEILVPLDRIFVAGENSFDDSFLDSSLHAEEELASAINLKRCQSYAKLDDKASARPLLSSSSKRIIHPPSLSHSPVSVLDFNAVSLQEAPPPSDCGQAPSTKEEEEAKELSFTELALGALPWLDDLRPLPAMTPAEVAKKQKDPLEHPLASMQNHGTYAPRCRDRVNATRIVVTTKEETKEQEQPKKVSFGSILQVRYHWRSPGESFRAKKTKRSKALKKKSSPMVQRLSGAMHTCGVTPDVMCSSSRSPNKSLDALAARFDGLWDRWQSWTACGGASAETVKETTEDPLDVVEDESLEVIAYCQTEEEQKSG